MSIETIISFLNENAGKKVSSISDELMDMITTLKQTRGSETGKNFYKDADGNVVAIYCYYHKQWELVSRIEYGKKASTAHGLNTMCKEGTSAWTKQQRDAAKAKEALLARVISGELAPDQLSAEQERIEHERKAIVPHSNQEYSFASLDEALSV